MKKIISLIMLLGLTVLLSGCLSGLITKIPNAEFTKFEYGRGGAYGSASITATNAKKDASGEVVVESVAGKLDYGVVNFNFRIEGLKQSAGAVSTVAK